MILLKLILYNGSIRPGKYEGYPFSIDITVKLKLEVGKISFSVDWSKCWREHRAVSVRLASIF
jgi:hypothetical protein